MSSDNRFLPEDGKRFTSQNDVFSVLNFGTPDGRQSCIEYTTVRTLQNSCLVHVCVRLCAHTCACVLQTEEHILQHYF